MVSNSVGRLPTTSAAFASTSATSMPFEGSPGLPDSTPIATLAAAAAGWLELDSSMHR
eukprot:CAMPEP_0116884642 /NCGR_PEP_ID=MMETSP0463-20121206/17615_1 /TAXON_ID=181622 /ORGANISM="Strombidinopsis sp, Strain SopsisLIS2011" /LENGTH=57 /DNA_ID=CAMNT_0004541513 /DNA_START=437 /DNA_END=610 /DNA_ORIENTATION=+